MLFLSKPHASESRVGLTFCLENLWITWHSKGIKTLLLNTFHARQRVQIRTVEKASFSPQAFPLYPLTPGPNRAQTGFRKGLKTKVLGRPLALYPQTLFVYNTKTNNYFLSN